MNNNPEESIFFSVNQLKDLFYLLFFKYKSDAFLRFEDTKQRKTIMKRKMKREALHPKTSAKEKRERGWRKRSNQKRRKQKKMYFFHSFFKRGRKRR